MTECDVDKKIELYVSHLKEIMEINFTARDKALTLQVSNSQLALLEEYRTKIVRYMVITVITSFMSGILAGVITRYLFR